LDATEFLSYIKRTAVRIFANIVGYLKNKQTRDDHRNIYLLIIKHYTLCLIGVHKIFKKTIDETQIHRIYFVNRFNNSIIRANL